MTTTFNKGDIVVVDNYLRSVVLSDKPGHPECVVGYVKGGRSVWWTVETERVELDPDQDDIAEFAELYVDVDFSKHREGVAKPAEVVPEKPKHPPIRPRESQPFRRSQSAVHRWPGGRPGFAGALREMREALGLSQSRLAARAGYDHSYVSRLESDSRAPTCEAVISLANAMGVSDVERDELLQAAGFLPLDPANAVADEPSIGEAYAVLKDELIPDDVKEDLRSAIRMAMRQAQRAVTGWPAAS